MLEQLCGPTSAWKRFCFEAENTTMNTDLLTLFDADETTMRKHVAEALSGSDDGELFIEHAQAESLMFDNGRLKGGSFNTEQGFGLRAVAGEAVGYAHAGDLSVAALKRAAEAVGAVTKGYSGSYAAAPQRTNKKFYGDENPIGSPTFEEKVKVLTDIDAYLRGKDDKVRQVTASVAASWQVVDILRADGHRVRDIRPMTRINISVIVGKGDRQESGSYGSGGRIGFGDFIAEGNWQYGADEALRQALVNLEAIEAPAGTMDVVLGSGWPGVMLHEAVGHGLEGDFNRKRTSAFAGLLGQMVLHRASPWSMTARSTADAARSPSTTRARPPATTSHRERQARRLHAGPPERPADGHAADRQRPPPGLCPCADAPHDQHLHARRRQDARRDHRFREEGHLCRLLRRWPGGHHLRQVRLRLHRGLPHRER
ncbi:protease TldD [Rhizobium yanglingense]|nr:protease TldD [Rhizobium yanglingense]